MIEPYEEMSIFAAVAENGSFTSAALAIGRSKAYVSQQVSRLEAILGIQLLFRTTRKVSLTEAGKVYLEYCQGIQKTAHDARQSIAALQGEMTGSITVSAPHSFGEIIVSDILMEFQEKYPQIDIILDLSDNVRNLDKDGVDIAIRGGGVLHDDLVAIPLIEWRMLVVASPKYIDAVGTPTHPDDLANLNCIGFYHDNNRGWPLMIGDEPKRVRVTGDFIASSNPVIKKTVLAGKGIAWLPSYVTYQEIEDGLLVKVLEDYYPPKFSFYLTYLYQKSIPVKQRRLIDFFKNWFSQLEKPGLRFE